jgi:hypothetical protein
VTTLALRRMARYWSVDVHHAEPPAADGIARHNFARIYADGSLI